VCSPRERLVCIVTLGFLTPNSYNFGRPVYNKRMAENDDFDLVERATGILTEKDRRYLLGELDEELTQGGERNRRYRIRKRLRNALWDLYILHETMPLGDVETLFEEIYEWRQDVEVAQARGEEIPPAPEFIDAWKGSVQFLVFALVGLDIGHHELENAVSDAIYQHQLYFEDRLVDVDVTVEADWENADEYTLAELEELVDAGDLPDDPKLADMMLTALARKGRITPSEYQEFFEGVVDE